MAIIEIPVTLSGSVITAEDAAAENFINLSTEITPVQDLHGYDNPWPAGGGKNLLKYPSSGATINQVIFSVLKDTDNNPIGINANGTASAATDFYIVGSGANSYDYIDGVASGSYIYNGNDTYLPSVATLFIIEEGGTILAGISSQNKSATVAIDSTKKYRVFLRISSGQQVSNAKFYPMLRLSSVSDATFAPYSNICPISGHTEANIYREDEYDPTANPTLTIDLDGTRYGGTLNVLTGEMVIDKASVDLSSKTWNLNAQYSNLWVSTSGISDAKSGRTKILTECAPYDDPTLNSTILGAITNGTNNIWVRNGSGTVAPSGLAAYELASPLTVSLTPKTLSALVGTNVVWSDTGDTTLTYYRSVEMALSTMYPAKNGSPKTTLAQDITAAATSMALTDTSVLPPAPNLAVLGEDESAEIVLYNEITGGVVSGLVRGINGTTASVWPAGTAVARNFTSYDHDTIIENFLILDEEKAPKASPELTGTPTTPTASLATNTTQIASTAFVQNHAPIHLKVTASAGNAVTKSDSRITSTMQVINCVFGTPENVTSNVSWTTSSGSVSFSGTFTGSTTIDFDLVEVN